MVLRLRDPRVRAVILIVVALLGLGLAIDLTGEHSIVVDACVAVVVSLGLALLFPTQALREMPIGTVLEPARPRCAVVPVIGRDPPAGRTILLL